MVFDVKIAHCSYVTRSDQSICELTVGTTWGVETRVEGAGIPFAFANCRAEITALTSALSMGF